MSNYNVYVDALKKQGYGEEDANMKALWELYGRAPLEAGFSGFVMGALSGAMVNTSNVFEAGKYADAEKIGEYLKGELNQNYMGETGKAAASLRADAIKGLKTAGITQNPVRAAWNMGRAATGAAELADMPKLIINSDSVYRDINGEAQNKIETTKDGKKYVKADRQVISGSNPDTWQKQISNYINKVIRGGKDVTVIGLDGDVLTITGDTAGKARFRNYVTLPNGLKRPMTDTEFAAKLRAEAHIDELGQTSRRGSRTVPDTKSHAFATDGFNYRTAYFLDNDGSYYKITMSVGKKGNINTIYNVGKLKEAPFPHVAQRPYGKSAKGETSSTNSIRKNGGKYNSNFNQNNKWTSERIAQLDNAVKKSGVNIIIEDIFRGGTEEMNGFLARNYTAAREITDTMKNIIDSVKMRFAVEPSSVYERAVRSFEKALAKRETGGESGIQFSTADNSEEGKSVKQQLEENADKLNSMEAVFVRNDISAQKGNRGDNLNWILKELGTKDIRVQREGVGEIILDSKRISNSLRYLKSDGELAAYAALPDVLKNGTIIDATDNHKGRNYSTLTIGAPVVINEVRGNVAAVVKQDSGKNVYKVHRILLPDGSSFTYEKIKGGAERAEVNTQNALTRTPADTAFNNSILENGEKYNSNFNQDYQGENVKNSTGEVSPEILTEIITAFIYRLEEIKTAKRYIV